MKILALGGCGEMGRYAVTTLLNDPGVEEIVIGDINGENAKQLAGKLGSKASWTVVDVSDPSSLQGELGRVDLVMNTVGPYFRFGVTVLSSCIQAGCHYFDINDDWEPTTEMLNLDARAKERGVTAVLGMGASPGITNLLAAQAVAELDVAEAVYTGWDLESAKPEKIRKFPSAATVHGIHQLTGSIRVYDGGRFVDAKPLKKLRLEIPGFGTHAVWTVGHPEAVTIPRYYPDLQCSLNVFHASRTTLLGLKLIAALVNVGALSVDRAAWVAERIEGPAPAKRKPQEESSELDSGNRSRLPPIFALARGMKKGKPASVVSTLLSAPAGGMGPVTGVPLAVGASLLVHERIRRHGVFAPEAGIPPRLFFDALAPLCSPTKRGFDDLVLTLSSEQ